MASPFFNRYFNLSGDASLAAYAICCTLSGYTRQVDWRLFSPASWDLFLEIAQREGVAPLLYKACLADESPFPASDPAFLRVYEALKTSYYKNLRRNILIFHELNRILGVLDHAGIQSVLLKGAALAQTLYGDVGLRPMNDLDLLVPPNQLGRAVQAAHALGFVETIPEAARGLLSSLSHHVYLQKTPGNGLALELHWTLAHTPAHKFSAPADWFWTQALSVSAGPHASPRRVLSATAALLYAGAHLTLQHGLGAASLLWLYDLDRLARSGDVDWDLLERQAAALGWGAFLAPALALAQSCFATPLPSQTLENLHGSQDPQSALLQELKHQPSNSRSQAEWRTLASLKRGGQARLLLALVFPSRAYMLWRYRPRFPRAWWLIYPYRWLDIGRDLLWSLWLGLTRRFKVLAGSHQ